MRQAGRWDPEFRKLRGDLGFYEFAENAELAAKASLCPLRFGVDAIILFYDITTLALGMGQQFELHPGRGPVPDKPIRSMNDVEALGTQLQGPAIDAVFETLRLVRKELDDQLPVLVFAGAPFTLATYQIGIGRNLQATQQFIHEERTVWQTLLERICNATEGFLKELLAQGATAYQLFDSWAGALPREEYLAYAQPYHQRIFSAVGGLSILFVKDCPYNDLTVQSGAKVISVGTGASIAELRKAHPELAFQGNVDHQLIVSGTEEEVREATILCLQAGGGTRHILNLDHGMDKLGKPENFAAFVEAARNFRH